MPASYSSRSTSSKSARGLVHLTLALALISCGDDADRRSKADLSGRAPLRQRPTMERAIPDGKAPPEDRQMVEGGAAPKVVFDRAAAAVAKRDYLALLGCIRKDTRKRWLKEMTASLALDSGDEAVKSTEGKRAVAELKTILTTYGAKASFGKDEAVSTDALKERLFDHVLDPDGLFVALLDFAEAHHHRYDPVMAIESLTRPDSYAVQHGPSAEAAGLVRLVGRLEAPQGLGEIRTEGDRIFGLTAAPSTCKPNCPREEAFLPVLFRFEQDRYFLDES